MRHNILFAPEYDFIINLYDINKADSDLRILDLDNVNYLKIMQNLFFDHVPLSNQMSLVNETTIFLLTNLNKKIYFSNRLNTIISYDISNNNLYLKDIISQTPHCLSDITHFKWGSHAKCITLTMRFDYATISEP